MASLTSKIETIEALDHLSYVHKEYDDLKAKVLRNNAEIKQVGRDHLRKHRRFCQIIDLQYIAILGVLAYWTYAEWHDLHMLYRAFGLGIISLGVSQFAYLWRGDPIAIYPYLKVLHEKEVRGWDEEAMQYIQKFERIQNEIKNDMDVLTYYLTVSNKNVERD